MKFNWIISFLRFGGGSEKNTEIKAGSLSRTPWRIASLLNSLFATRACALKCEPARRLGLGKCNQPRPAVSADYICLDLDYSGYHKNLIQLLFIIRAQSRGCPITSVWFKLFVIGYPRNLHVNYARFNGFFCNVSHSFQQFWEALQILSLKKTSQKTFLIPKFVTSDESKKIRETEQVLSTFFFAFDPILAWPESWVFVQPT